MSTRAERDDLIALIDAVLRLPKISQSTRDDLRMYRRKIVDGSIEADDRRYVLAICERLRRQEAQSFDKVAEAEFVDFVDFAESEVHDQNMTRYNLNDIPLDLMERCTALVRMWNRKEPVNFDRVIWHRETMVMLMMIQETRELLGDAQKAWRRTTRDDCLIPICAAVLALEILNSDYCGWGSLHPLAQRKAADLLKYHSMQDKQRMMTIFKILELGSDRQFSETIKSAFDPRSKA